MIELFGELYYIDFLELDKFLTLDKQSEGKIETKTVVETAKPNGDLVSTKTTTQEHIAHKEIDGVKFELVRNFITDIGDDGHEEDSRLGEHSLEKTSIRFKLAFNTLLAYRLLKKID
jgi:hypothetical protein